MGLLESLGIKNQLKELDEEAISLKEDSKTLNESFAMSATGALGFNGPQTLNQGVPQGNFIGDSFYDTGGLFGRAYNNPGMQEVEKGYIVQQRAISVLPEIAIGIEEIMKDLYNKEDPLLLDIDLPDGYEVKYEGDIKEVYSNFNIFKKKPFTVVGNNQTPTLILMFNLLKQTYVDGHLCVYACKVPVEPKNPIEDKLQDISKAYDATYGAQTLNPYASATPQDLYRGQGKLPWYSQQQSMVHGFMLESEEPEEYEDPFARFRTGPGKTYDLKTLRPEDLDDLLEAATNTKKVKKVKKEVALEANKGKEEIESNEQLIFIPLDPTRISYQNGIPTYDLIKGTLVPLNEAMLITADFGLFDTIGARYGFLQYAFKYANQLQSLQDMLVPMRFRRSVARRIFNVDIGNLPQARATEYMMDTQRKFKYKKTYDTKNGKIRMEDSEQVGIVEDYWFANRAGGKGTTVEMLDEAGNFADSLEDIAYFNKKLYQSMFIPLRRVFESDSEYDYTANSIEVDEMRFNAFLDRMRFVFNSVFTKMFKIYLEQVTDYDEELIEACVVRLNYNNTFEQNQRFDRLEKALVLFSDAKEYLGKIYSAETLLKTVFDMNADDVQSEVNKIKAELDSGSIYYPFFIAMTSEGDDSDGY